ncbi:coiled-coil domain-containing protein 112-like [Phlebotomus argentipes]|uniref:coiled-coil domain-containing protein 112-like n=1 Tax=Phlebotomus argentipes TaxID=94469 RepID=UPI002892C158|nr:coiled-coil domain-containing protein 112-like [Phlebotomus argentipes]
MEKRNILRCWSQNNLAGCPEGFACGFHGESLTKCINNMAESRVARKKLSATACICLLSRLKCQENYLANVQTPLEVHFPEDEDAPEERKLLAEIDVLRDRLTVNFVAGKVTAQHTVASIRGGIEEFKSMGANIQQHDLKDYRERILQIEENLTRVQNTNKLNYGKMKFENMDIVATIPPTVDLLKDEAKRHQNVPNRVTQMRSGTLKPVDEGVYKDVKMFDQFLEDFGGHTGGWGEEQHVIFVRSKSKYMGNLRRITETLLEQLPGMTPEDIEGHDKWYEEYMRLKANRKKSLEDWRKSK